MKKHLFFRRIERNIDKNVYTIPSWEMLMDMEDDGKIAEKFHSWFNFYAGESYAWPIDNITKECLDKSYLDGQRSFVFFLGYKEMMVYDVRMITNDEFIEFKKQEELEKRNGYCETCGEWKCVDIGLGECLGYATDYIPLIEEERFVTTKDFGCKYWVKKEKV